MNILETLINSSFSLYDEMRFLACKVKIKCNTLNTKLI